ncbi:MAG TPA: hypothetical protein VLM40_21525, partial [Gemmata sp.]|nr:hypothetical protein [Gemmata sp.]
MSLGGTGQTASGDAGRAPWFGLRVQGKEAKVFHARMWGWKRLAANLLLLPVLGGWSIGTAQAQYRSAGFPQSASGAMPATRSGGSAPATTSGDPQAILRDGRKALAAGQFDRAQDLAQLAQRSNPSGKWRLFDDTPRSLLQDIQDAVAKKHKAQSEQLIHDARALVSRKTSSEVEKASNLDRAYQMAEQAYQLHGPYSAWDLGDRADKLMKQIKSARGKLNVPATAVASNNMPNTASSATSGQYNSAFQTEFQPNGAPANRQAMAGAGQSSYGSAFQPDFQPQGGSPNHVTQASGTTGYNSTLGGGFQTGVGSAPQGSMPPSRQSDYGSALQPSAAVANRVNTPANDARKATVAQMMNEARGLADQNDFAGARAKLAQADRVGAIFGSDEYNPGNAIQELNARGSRAIDTLVADCGRQMGKKDYEKAEAAIDEASRIATSLGLYARGVDEMRTQLKWKTGHSGSTGVVAAGNAAMQQASPVDAIPAKAIDTGKPVVPASGNIDARQLLAQAHIEFRNNSLDT